MFTVENTSTENSVIKYVMKMTFMIISFVKMDDIKLNILSVLRGYLCNCKLLFIR